MVCAALDSPAHGLSERFVKGGHEASAGKGTVSGMLSLGGV